METKVQVIESLYVNYTVAEPVYGDSEPRSDSSAQTPNPGAILKWMDNGQPQIQNPLPFRNLVSVHLFLRSSPTNRPHCKPPQQLL